LDIFWETIYDLNAQLQKKPEAEVKRNVRSFS